MDKADVAYRRTIVLLLGSLGVGIFLLTVMVGLIGLALLTWMRAHP